VPERHDAAQARNALAIAASIGTLPDARVDALIVTGCEPVRSSLADEPYYPSLTRLIDSAKDNTVSTIWSCLAAHAAVLHLDDIRRHKLARKLTGVYEFERMSDHPLLRGITEPVRVSHSRLNGLKANELVAHGYMLLTHSDEAGVDAFIKKYGSLFVFLQGHPEYEPDSLYREYRRDMTRYLTGQQPICPAPPENYFDCKTVARLTEFAEGARAGGNPDLIECFAGLDVQPSTAVEWRRPPSGCLPTGWISGRSQGPASAALARARRGLTSRKSLLAARTDLI
jgi:homoserine O-succinyltransferase/O-acetyltransferase